MLSGNLFVSRDMQLVAILIQNENLAAPGLINLAGEDFTHLLAVFSINIGLLDVENASLKILADIEDAAPAERTERQKLGIGIPYLVIILSAVFLYIFQCHLLYRVRNLLYNLEVLIDFASTFVHVYNDVKIVTVAIGFS